MKIDKSHLKMGIWYEDKDGNVIPHNGAVLPPENAYTYHSCFPLELSEDIYLVRDEDGNLIDKPFSDRKLLTGHTHIGGGNSDVIMAMVNSGDYSLPEAIAVFGFSCERCMNVLAYKYLNGADGYPEHSEQWNSCNTECDFCKDEDNNESID